MRLSSCHEKKFNFLDIGNETKYKSWERSILLKYRVIRVFQNHDRSIRDNSAPDSVGENSRRSRKLGSRRRINGTARRILQRGRFPSGFPQNTRDVWRTCRTATRSRIWVLLPEVPREYRARLLVRVYADYLFKTREPNAVISRKAAA